MPAIASRLRYTVDPFPASPAPQGGFTLLESTTLPCFGYAAFTGLRHAPKIGAAYGTLFACWREGAAHASSDGVIVVARKGGPGWSRCAVLSTPYTDKKDLRDPKIITLADGSLLLNCVASNNSSLWQSLVAFSTNGNTWSAFTPVGNANDWLWRHTQHPSGDLYAVGYAPGLNPTDTTLYRSTDGGHTYSVLIAAPFIPGGSPDVGDVTGIQFNETGLCFRADGSAVAVARTEHVKYSTIGTASAPYTSWTWRQSTPTSPDASASRCASPCVLELPDGRVIVACRRYYTGQRCMLEQLDPATGLMTPLLTLSWLQGDASGADVGYPGQVWFRNQLFVSYHTNEPTNGGNPVIRVDRVGVN